MNKNDLKLIIIIILFSIIILLSFTLFSKNDSKIAKVYYENNLILEIDLENSDNKIYEVEGYNGIVEIEVKNNKIQVIQEESPLHLCSKQGFISNSYESIVCLPNKIIITIEKNDDYDTVVR